jgi:hypothetical protein
MIDDDDIQEYVRPWVGLTEEEFEYCCSLKNPTAIVEEVEAKLKEKNS